MVSFAKPAINASGIHTDFQFFLQRFEASMGGHFLSFRFYEICAHDEW